MLLRTDLELNANCERGRLGPPQSKTLDCTPSMDAFAQYLNLWNSWVVFPALLVVAAAAHWRFRRPSTLVLMTGLALLLVGQAIRVLYPAPLHAAYVPGLAFDATGLIAALCGFVWFMWKDYRAPPRAI